MCIRDRFDATWGGPDLMYAERLGIDRGTALNPYSRLHSAGVLLAFGSDSPVTALDPWGGVRAAVEHRTPSLAIDVATAFAASTRNGHRAVGVDDCGRLAPGERATFAAWDSDSADATLWAQLSGLGHLEMAPGTPRCVRTVVDGVTIGGEVA